MLSSSLGLVVIQARFLRIFIFFDSSAGLVTDACEKEAQSKRAAVVKRGDST